MANNFKGYEVVGVTAETVVYTGATATQSTVIGLTIANTSGVASLVSVKKNTAYLVLNAPVPAGGSLIVVGGNQKLVVEPTNTISVIADNTVDVIMSTLEIV